MQVGIPPIVMHDISASMRRQIRKLLGFSFKFIPQIRQALEHGLTVFVFHEVSDKPSRFAEEHGLAVSIERFHRQVCWIQANFNVIRPTDLLSETCVPKRAAMISFDDGFSGSFENGLTILEQLNLPSICFLNMQAILEKKPILSATACFLDRYVPEFADFAKSVGLPLPFHLTLSPSILNAFERRYGPVDQDAVIEYQGRFAELKVIREWDAKNLVAFGNHLYDHWNAAALSLEEFEDQYKRNEVALSLFKNRVNLFAFTNGQPKTCFSSREVVCLSQLGVGKVFSSSGGVNCHPSTKYLLGRLSLAEGDSDEDYLWFRIGRAVFNDRSMSLSH